MFSYNDSVPKMVSYLLQWLSVKDDTAAGADREPPMDHWIQEQDGVLIRKHLVPRTHLYMPDLEDPMLKHTYNLSSVSQRAE